MSNPAPKVPISLFATIFYLCSTITYNMNTETIQKEAYTAPESTIVEIAYESIICGSTPPVPYGDPQYMDW